MTEYLHFQEVLIWNKAKSMEKNPNERKLNNLLTLKNSPTLNKYNFTYNKNRAFFKS